MAEELERFGVSIEAELLRTFDRYIEEKQYSSRSEALRDLIRDRLNAAVATEDPKEQAMGTLTIFYDHTRRELTERLTHVGHAHHELILSTLHFHLDNDRCMEVMALKGAVGELRHFADAVASMKGVQHGKLVVTVEPTSKPGAKKHSHGHSHGHGHSHDHD
jgi:CopG family nickel-responsive transcriptional regulator